MQRPIMVVCIALALCGSAYAAAPKPADVFQWAYMAAIGDSGKVERAVMIFPKRDMHISKVSYSMAGKSVATHKRADVSVLAGAPARLPVEQDTVALTITFSFEENGRRIEAVHYMKW